MIRRYFLPLLLAMFPLLACAAEDNSAASYQAGTHYDLINPSVRMASADKIEVTEFFWYGCGHCYTFEPLLQKWKQTLADDVIFTPSPAVWNASMELHAKAYYTAQLLRVEEKVHAAIFQAMNVDRKRLRTEEEIAEVFIANGVSAEDFSRAFNSFGISSQVRKASSTARAAQITGTPALMVNGKYHISTQKAGGQAQMLQVADYLIEQERAAAAQ